ncbi:hypothetical protein [Massilia pseudoviolaceinigra]|uniref:hypothetical protein n=1 Tax=Massilia pseudoviolaceinigra TaxID=3057165 RepID=UPI0027964BB1|nr:hypothetical protein [Massilia sp. CCM 9206]MDQ1920737.1 hypothetical protein [Massilia sp. CCM 9206]
MQLRLARWHDAEQTFRNDLTINPRSAWALRGMSRALLGLGKKAEAAKIEHDMATAWPLADPQLRRVR